MYSYYLKILIWTCLHLLTTFTITYIVIDDINKVIVLSTGQMVVMLTVYSPFEYYYGRCHESLYIET